MNWIEFFGIFITALLIGAIFFYGFSVRGPWGSFWTFLIVLIGGIWLVSAIADPVGPLYWDVAWLDFLFIGLIFALILSAATPTRVDRERYREIYANYEPENPPEEAVEPVVAVGIWFWLMLFLIIIAIIIAIMA